MNYFGPLGSENDPRILDYFQTTKQITQIVSIPKIRNKFIMVVRPGGGKTALVNWLRNGPNKNRVVSISSDKVRYILEIDKTANGKDLQLLFSSELYNTIISNILETDNYQISDNLRFECKEYLDNFSKELKSFLKNRFKGISIMGTGITLEPSDRQSILEIIRKENRILLGIKILGKISSELNLILVVDNPESIVGQGLDGITPENGLRIGAFLSCLNEINSKGIQVIVFIKEHIIQLVQREFDDYSHFSDLIDGLEWTDKDLLELLIQRIVKGLQSTWDDVFDLTPSEFEKLVFPYLINGPRDLIHICNLAGEEEGKISKIALQRSVDIVCREKLLQIKKEFDSQWPKIDIFTQCIIQITLRENKSSPFSRKQFINPIEKEFETPGTGLHNLRKEADWINSVLLETPPIDERLYLLGVLGYVYNGSKFYPWSGRFIDRYHLSDKIFISPVFTK